MRLHEAGLILFTSKYEEMVRFYRDQLCLPVRADKQFFIVFQWGYGYLMLEPYVEGHRVQPPHNGVSPHVLRLNVFDIERTVDELRLNGIEVAVETFEWGVVATFCDPDGNVLELKDAPDFYE